jgi:hypothetical protein
VVVAAGMNNCRNNVTDLPSGGQCSNFDFNNIQRIPVDKVDNSRYDSNRGIMIMFDHLHNRVQDGMPDPPEPAA